jgi:hypothetical protein
MATPESKNANPPFRHPANLRGKNNSIPLPASRSKLKIWLAGKVAQLIGAKRPLGFYKLGLRLRHRHR